MFEPFLKVPITFRQFIVHIPFKYCQKGIKKKILNIQRKIQDS